MNTETENGTQMTLEQWLPQACPQQTVGVSGSHARTSALPENRQDSADTVLLCFSQLQGLLETQKKKIDPNTCLLRTWKTYLALTGGAISSNFSLSWTRSGTMRNGRLSTVKISEYRKTGSGCSLSDILEESVPEKYFLSREQVEKIAFQ